MTDAGLPMPLEGFRPLLHLQARQLGLHPKLRRRFDESDLVQEVLLRAHKQREQFRGTSEAELAGWVRQILTTTAIDMIRRETAEGRAPDAEVHLEQTLQRSARRWDAILPDHGETPSEIARRLERLEALAKALEQLPEAESVAITAKDLMGMTVAETAECVGRTEQATAGLLRRGRARLRELLQEHEETRDG